MSEHEYGFYPTTGTWEATMLGVNTSLQGLPNILIHTPSQEEGM